MSLKTGETISERERRSSRLASLPPLLLDNPLDERREQNRTERTRCTWSMHRFIKISSEEKTDEEERKGEEEKRAAIGHIVSVCFISLIWIRPCTDDGPDEIHQSLAPLVHHSDRSHSNDSNRLRHSTMLHRRPFTVAEIDFFATRRTVYSKDLPSQRLSSAAPLHLSVAVSN